MNDTVATAGPLCASGCAEDTPVESAAGGRAGQVRNHLLTLWSRPASFLAAMLLLNALFLPYRARYHDAILYGFQVLNRVQDNRFADDLFLRFGSQDSYSLFSTLAAPLASLLGIPAAFFCLYLASKTLLFWGALRLVRTLVAESWIAALGLLLLAVSEVPMGGFGVFEVNESFLTPRLLAVALVLFGLERMLAGRLTAALLLLLLSMAMHPLMGYGGLLLFILWYLSCGAWRKTAWVCAGIGTIAIGAAMLIPPLGMRLFGYMDPVWREQVAARLPCLLGDEWPATDWLHALAATAIALLAWQQSRASGDSQRGHFLGALAGLTVLAAFGTILVCYLPYALLLQGQPFRALWLAEALQAPLSLMLAAQWWPTGRTAPRFGAVFVVGYCAGVPLQPSDVRLGAVLFVLLAVVLRSLSASRAAQWAPLALAGSMAGVLVLGTAGYWVGLIANWEHVATITQLDERLYSFFDVLEPACRLLLGLTLLLGMLNFLGHRRFAVAALLLMTSVQLGSAALPRLSRTQPGGQPSVGFIHEFLRDRRPGARQATVYWANNHVENLWFDLGVDSYYSHSQLAGNVFSRTTAMEGRRRGALVAPFEFDSVRRQRRLLEGRRLREIERTLGVEVDAAPPPDAAHLLRLCGEHDLDVVVIRQGFPGLYAATDDAWFLYDCAALRHRPEFAAYVTAARPDGSPRAAAAAVRP